MRASANTLVIALSAVGAIGNTIPLAADEPARLTPAMTSAQIPLGVAPDGPVIVVLEIGSVLNPQLLPVSVHVALADAERRSAPIPLATVSLFPADRGGRFMLPAAATLRDLERATGESRPATVMLVQLAEPARTDSAQGDLALEGVRGSWAPTPRD